MDERIKFEIVKSIGNLDANFTELNRQVRDAVARYKGLVYNEEQITEAKSDLASLRADRKLIDDSRKTVKKEFMKPYETFESKVKETLGIFDEAISEISAQVDAATVAEQKRKKAEIEKWWSENGVESIDGVTLEQVWDARYLNKTYTTKKWQEDLKAKRDAIEKDLTTISFFDAEMMNFVLPMYKNTLNLAEATASYEKFKANQKATEEARLAMEAKRAEREREKPTQPKKEEPAPIIVEPVKPVETAEMVAETVQESPKTKYWQMTITVRGNESVIRTLSDTLRNLKLNGLWFKVNDKNSWEE